MIIFSVLSLSTTAAEIVVYLVLSGVIFFTGNRIMKLIEKIDVFSEFVARQVVENGQLQREMETLRHDQKQLESELKTQMGRLEDKLDDFILEIRKERVPN